MDMTTPEFSHKLALNHVGELPQNLHLVAGEKARAALAHRFGLEQINSLQADLVAERRGTQIAVTGPLVADVVQQCVVSAEPVPARIDEPVCLLFETDPRRVPADDEEVTAESADILPVEGNAVDLGEAIAQSLLLALDPYPHADAETLAAARRHLLSEEEAEVADAEARRAAKMADNPFAALRKP